MQLKSALKYTRAYYCKWCRAIGIPQVMLSGEGRLRQPVWSYALAQHGTSQLGDVRAPPGSSVGDWLQVAFSKDVQDPIKPFLGKKLQANREP